MQVTNKCSIALTRTYIPNNECLLLLMTTSLPSSAESRTFSNLHIPLTERSRQEGPHLSLDCGRPHERGVAGRRSEQLLDHARALPHDRFVRKVLDRDVSWGLSREGPRTSCLPAASQNNALWRGPSGPVGCCTGRSRHSASLVSTWTRMRDDQNVPVS